MDLDHLFKLVEAARDEAEAINDCGPAYDALTKYIAEPWRELEVTIRVFMETFDTCPSEPSTELLRRLSPHLQTLRRLLGMRLA